MNKALYSYQECLVYFLDLFKRHYKEESLLDRSENFHSVLINLCGSSPENFWAYFRERKISYLEYRNICQRIKSYLVKRELISHITGKCFFFGIPIKIKRGVFIPQPDTEVLVNVVSLLSKEIWPLVEKIRLLEIGCGSGNIVIALALRRSLWDIFAIDINKKALSLAKRNAFELDVKNIQFFFSNQFSRVTGKFHIVVSNPPYVSFSEYNSLDESVRKQPRDALLSANDGYFFYEKIIRKIHLFLEKKFLVVLEIGYKQKERVLEIILSYFPLVKIKTFKDFNRNERVIAFYQH